MNFATFLVATLVATIFIIIVVKAVGNFKKGKSSCACGSDCSRCSRCGH